ncbi:MAG: class A beta-lactamase-related serine hydrolase [Candidatus Saccharibacteria bacterium]|nr:class A beta-lactamase-related serine hydrolase [Candidatus Saccharibacteria bacterium]
MKEKYKRLIYFLIFGLVMLATSFMVGWNLANRPQQSSNQLEILTPTDSVQQSNSEVSNKTDTLLDNPNPSFDKAILEKIVADFAHASDARLSIVIEDLTNQDRLLSHNAEDIYPTASLYKLYLAYLVYEDIDNNLLTLTQPFFRHNLYRDLDLRTCLNLMIEVSDSPCGEALLRHYGYPVIQTRLEKLDLKQIHAAGFRTSAEEMIKLLSLIYGDNLSEDSRKRLLTAMHNQSYRRLLQPAFDNYAKVYNKTGTYLNQAGDNYNWIDVGIIELNDRNQVLAISVFQEDVLLEDLNILLDNLAQAIFDQSLE